MSCLLGCTLCGIFRSYGPYPREFLAVIQAIRHKVARQTSVYKGIYTYSISRRVSKASKFTRPCTGGWSAAYGIFPGPLTKWKGYHTSENNFRITSWVPSKEPTSLCVPITVLSSTIVSPDAENVSMTPKWGISVRTSRRSRAARLVAVCAWYALHCFFVHALGSRGTGSTGGKNGLRSASKRASECVWEMASSRSA